MNKPPLHRRGLWRVAFLATLFVCALLLSLYLSETVANNAAIQILIERYGYIAIVGMAVIAGLNALVPVPAATF